MTYRLDDGQMGSLSIEAIQVVPSFSPGFIAVAEDPIWGAGEFFFARANANIALYNLCTLLEVWDPINKVFIYNMTPAPANTTTLINRSVYVYQGNVALATGQYGWFQNTGRSPVASNINILADTAIGRSLVVGQAGTRIAGAQLLNARVDTPSTQTVVTTKTILGASGDDQIGVVSTDGFFPGVYVSGTGVGAAAICKSADPISKVIQVSVVNSAQVSGNVTATYNNGTIFYNVLSMNRMFGQGAIT